MKYKSIFISDVHLGSQNCQAELLCKFLKENDCENLFLVGDIIDGWKLKKSWYFPQSHANVIRRVLTKSKRGTKVFYIAGNHDEFLRPLIRYDLTFGNIIVKNKFEYDGIDGKRYFITHGDMFDSLMNANMKWVMFLGDHLYNILMSLNFLINKIRSIFGKEYWSLSKYLKHKTKRAMNFIQKYEIQMARYCFSKGFDGIICGHIHTAEIKNIEGVIYMNSGDWVESCTALVEHEDGRFEIICYNDSKK